MKRNVIAMLCTVSMMLSACPQVLATDTVADFYDGLDCTRDTFLDSTDAGYLTQRVGKSQNCLDFENMGGTLGTAVHRGGAYFNESAYLTYRVRPETNVIVSAYDKVDGYDISFSYQTGNGVIKPIAARIGKTGTKTDRNNNSYPTMEYILTIPADADTLTVHLPEISAKDAPTTPLWSNWMVGITDIELYDINFSDMLEGKAESFADRTADGFVPQRVSAVGLQNMTEAPGGLWLRSAGNTSGDADLVWRCVPGLRFYCKTADNSEADASFYVSRDAENWVLLETVREEGVASTFLETEYQTVTNRAMIPDGMTYVKASLPKNSAEDIGFIGASLEGLQAKESILRWNDVHQEIDGFGGAMTIDAATHAKHSNGVVDFLYDPVDGLGFTILRCQMPTGERADGQAPLMTEDGVYHWDRDASQVWFFQEVQKYEDVTTLSCSWTPMYWMKTSKQMVGGSLLPEYYQDYAEFFCEYVEGYEREHGIKIDIISIQNEPESTPPWDTCIMTGDEFHVLIRDYLQPEIEKRGLDVKIMTNDAANFRFPVENFPYLLDDETKDHVDYISGHSYWDYQRFPLAKQLQKRVWQTESSDTNTPDNPSIEYGLSWAQEMHVLLTKPEVNAFVWWYNIHRYGNSEALITCNCDGTYRVNKRCWAAGHYSKWVRPGYWRIGVEESPYPDVLLTAFKDEESGKCVVVCINDGTETHQIDFVPDGFTTTGVNGWRTSEHENMQELGYRTVTDNHVMLELAPRSITTFVFDGCTSLRNGGLLEAEYHAKKIGNGQNVVKSGFSGGVGVHNIGAADNGVWFEHLKAADSLSIRYASVNDENCNYKLYVNDEYKQTLTFPSTIAAGVSSGDVMATVEIPEDATIKLLAEADTEGICIDYVILNPVTEQLNLMDASLAAQDYSWAYNAMDTTADLLGVETDSAGKIMLRGDFIKALVEARGLSASWTVNYFDAYDKMPYYQQLGIAKELGITPTTGENKIYAEEYLTRADMFSMVANALKLSGKTVPEYFDPTPYADWDLLTDEAKEAAKLLISAGIISGDGQNLNPNGYVSYAVAAVVLSQILK